MIGAIVLLAAMVAGPNLGAGISPAVVSGPAHSVSEFTITDAGNMPEHITVQVVEMRPVTGHPGEWVPFGEYGHYTVNHPEFNLAKGASRTVKVTINAPDGYQHQLAVFAESSPASKPTGIARIHASVAARYVINPDGKMAPNAPNAVNVPTPTQAGGFPTVPIAGGIVLAAILGTLAGIWRHRRKRRPVSSEPDHYGMIP